MFKLKPLSKNAIPDALDKANRYRLLGEPIEAESICLDILSTAPGHQQALICLLLALADQFEDELQPEFDRAMEVLKRINDAYDQQYYHGILCERRAKAHMDQGIPGCGPMAYEWFICAMNAYERAMELSADGNDDAILRWNTCVRIMERHPQITPVVIEEREPMLE